MRPVLWLASLLIAPLAALLCAQWPLREWVQAYSRQANDAAQIAFALYAAVAVTAATRAGSHLSAAAVHSPSPAWKRWALAACILPWAAFMLWVSAPSVWASLLGLEKFPETLSPGYFLIKLASWLLLLLAAVQAVVGLRSIMPQAPQGRA